MHEVKETFDFGYDWEFLHQIFPEDREKYVINVYNILKPGAKYLSICFSEKDPLLVAWVNSEKPGWEQHYISLLKLK